MARIEWYLAYLIVYIATLISNLVVVQGVCRVVACPDDAVATCLDGRDVRPVVLLSSHPINISNKDLVLERRRVGGSKWRSVNECMSLFLRGDDAILTVQLGPSTKTPPSQ